MADYTKKEIEAKKQTLRNRSVLSYANTVNEINLFLLDHRVIKNKISHCESELRFNNTGFYRSSNPYKCTTFVNRKQLEEELRDLESRRKLIEKRLDDLVESL